MSYTEKHRGFTEIHGEIHKRGKEIILYLFVVCYTSMSLLGENSAPGAFRFLYFPHSGIGYMEKRRGFTEIHGEIQKRGKEVILYLFVVCYTSMSLCSCIFRTAE